jgi:hypothetical protein
MPVVDFPFDQAPSRWSQKYRGVGVEEFDRLADQAKTGWPVSKALGTIELSLSARLV